MKKVMYLIILIGFAQSAMAQSQLERANDYFEKSYYADAIPLYEMLLPKHRSFDLIRNLADSYYHTFDMKLAERWYAHLIANHTDKVTQEHYFKYAHTLKANGDLDAAQKVWQNYYEQSKDSEATKKLGEEFKYLENVSAIGNRYDITNLPLNTPSSEFGAIVKDSLLMFSATRKKTGVVDKLYRWNNQNYLDVYTHAKNQLQYGDSLSKPFPKSINSKMHEGTFVFSYNGKTLYFTRNNMVKGKRKTNEDKISNLKIYRATYNDGKWEDITPLSFNDDDYSCAHPALNADGTKLYFSSDRPGGFGSFDLYYVNIEKDGSFGDPVNLGQTINTERKEQFPFMDSNNNLYFSSNGHPGFGLMDIFIAASQNDKFNVPNNLGLPLNSGYDDFSFFLDQDGQTGYFASNRLSGKGSDDIYSFTETKPLLIEDCKQYSEGIVADVNTEAPIANAKVELFNHQGKPLESIVTDKNGAYQFNVKCAAQYKVLATKSGYEENSKSIRTDKKRGDIKNGDVSLFSIKERKRQEQLRLKKRQEEETARLKREKQKQLRKEKEAKERQELQKQREEEEKKKAIALQKEETAKRIEHIVKTEDNILKDKNGTFIKTKEIHFDYGMWHLRRETRERLNALASLIKKYPKMIVEIRSHTDIRGNSGYNKELSQKRADAVKDFLVKNGISQQRITAIGYGESQPIVKCKSEETCTEEDHEWNRRCEFKVVSWE